MKIAVVYTGVTKELVEMVERETDRYFAKTDAEFLRYEAPQVIADIKKQGFLSPAAKAKMMAVYQEAVADGAGILFNICSSVREAAEEAKEILAKQGVRMVLFDERAIERAAASYCKLGLAGTLPTAIAPTRRRVEACMGKLGKDGELSEYEITGSFGLGPKELKEQCLHVIRRGGELSEAVFLVQGSMACVEKELEEALGIPVMSGLGPGVEELWEVYKSYEG